jgi:hypothetical protein
MEMYAPGSKLNSRKAASAQQCSFQRPSSWNPDEDPQENKSLQIPDKNRTIGKIGCDAKAKEQNDLGTEAQHVICLRGL